MSKLIICCRVETTLEKDVIYYLKSTGYKNDKFVCIGKNIIFAVIFLKRVFRGPLVPYFVRYN